MRTIGAAALVVCALATQHRPAIGQEACGPDKLGVARTAAIDAAGGPHFGARYHDRKTKPLLADGEVVLTFDDGPSRAYTRSILGTLAAQCTKATFFMVGRMALADPDTAKEVAAQGHTVATHTWSHVSLAGLADDKAQTEIELGFSAVQQALGRPIAPFFRFPYLRHSDFTLHHLESRQIATFDIDIDSRDFATRNAAALHDRVIAGVKARRKGIILFHDIHASTARALPLILADLRSLGLRVVHLAPKTAAKTVAEYDKLAQQELARRRLAIARSPLAKRAVTWPMGSGGAKGGVQDAKLAAKDTKAVKAADDAAPPTAPGATASPPAPPAPQEDWAAELWSRAQ
ncbi:MAG: polysaccharide deacetylase family protein [Hyphomicrobiaceae bacterium]